MVKKRQFISTSVFVTKVVGATTSKTSWFYLAKSDAILLDRVSAGLGVCPDHIVAVGVVTLSR